MKNIISSFVPKCPSVISIMIILDRSMKLSLKIACFELIKKIQRKAQSANFNEMYEKCNKLKYVNTQVAGQHDKNDN